MIKNGFYNVLGFLVRSILNFLTIPVLISTVGIEEYGLWTLLFTIISIAVMAEGGLSSSTTLFVSQSLNESTDRELSQVLTVTSTSVIFLATFASIVLVALSPVVTESIPNLSFSQKATLPLAIQYSALVVWMKILQGIPTGIQAALKNYKFLSFATTAQAIVTSIGMILIAWIGGKSIAFLQWHIVVNTFSFVIYLSHTTVFLKKRTLRLSFEKSKYAEILKYSIWIWATSLGGAIFQQGDKIVVAAMLTPRELGAYGAITSTAAQINSFSATAVQPLLPVLGGLFHEIDDNTENVNRQIKQSFQVNSLIALTCGGVMIMLEDIITNALFSGKNVYEYKISFCFAVLVYAIYSVNAVGYYTLLAFKRAQVAMIATISSSILSLFLIYFGSSVWGLPGAVAGNAGFIGVWSLSFIAMTNLKIPFHVWSKWIAPPLLFAISVVSLKIFFIGFEASISIRDLIATILYVIIMFLWFFLENKSLVSPLIVKLYKSHSK
jgi:O-antigen/teichoic acid export membrane protein